MIAPLIAAASMAIGQAKLPAALPDSPAAAATAAPAAAQAATYTSAIDGRTAVVTPSSRGEARADGGFIDVQIPSSNVLTTAMTGTTAAFVCAGKSSEATQGFEVAQDFEVTCSDASVRLVDLTIDSTLTGFLRSKAKAGAAVRLAEVSVAPCLPGAPPLVAVHPPIAVSCGDARLVNHHLPRIKGSGMPLGRYRLVGHFRIESTAGGLGAGHAVADFSPTTTLPDTWVRARDPFQGVDKSKFGLSAVVTAEAAADSPVKAAVRIRPVDGEVLRSTATAPARPAPRVASVAPSMPWKVSITNPPTRR